MSKINLTKAVIGGIVAGVVINFGEFVLNALILGNFWERAMRELGKPTMSNQAIVYFVLSGFVTGILAVWLYAAIRPRFGPGPKTAICAGLAVWALAYLSPTIGLGGMGLFPRRVLALGLVWGIFEAPIATVVGAWLYKEEG